MFESLDDAGVRTAGTTYLMYRGRHRHEPATETALARIASTVFRAAGAAARASSSTPTCSPRAAPAAARSSACPGVRDQHAGCVGAYLVEHDLFDFLLLSLPDNDTHSHKQRPVRPGDLARRRRPPDRAASCTPPAGRTRSSRTTR